MSEMNAPRNGLPTSNTPSEHKGIGFGLFLVLAGLALLAERLGWLPNSFDWLLPVILIAWGCSELLQRLKGN